MAGEPDCIVLEHLRHIRRVVDKLESEVTEVKPRIASFEATLGHLNMGHVTLGHATMGHVMPPIGHLQAQIASQTRRIDQIEVRLDRIEAKLDLMPA